MIVCIDTNTLIQGRVPRHRYFPILDAVVAGRLNWAISNRVLAEYEEIVTASAGAAAWTKLEMLMELIDVTTGNLIRVSPHFQFHVIGEDPDDNAFTDCAIAAHADFVITEDHHFKLLANAGYKPQPITPADFMDRYRGLYV
jgi:putative PIN family toxin of toxin-antitoxin system